jgi:hypothetical protein
MTPHASGDLIERLEKATGPDRELGIAVCAACKVRVSGYGRTDEIHAKAWIAVNGDPTGSLDAAMELMPEPNVEGDKGRVVETRFDFGRSMFWATVNYDHHGRGATPAIALCIAALRARDAQAGRGT